MPTYIFGLDFCSSRGNGVSQKLYLSIWYSVIL